MAIVNLMTKRGRPFKDEAEKRGNVLRIMLTEDERSELDECAKRNTLDTSTSARKVLLETCRIKD